MSAMEGYQKFSFTILLLICVTVPLCHTARLPQPPDGRHQEKEVNRAAEDYMRKLYQQMTDESGELKSGTGLSSVSCFSGAVVHGAEDGYRAAGEKCTTIAQFSFNLGSLADTQPIALQKGLLRVHMQMKSIERADIELTARIRDYPDSETVSITTRGWVEIPVTDGLQNLFSSKPLLGHLEVSLQAKLDCKEQRINAAAIRFRNPLLVVFMDADEKVPLDEFHLRASETFKRSADSIDHEDVGESGSGEVTPTADGSCQRQPLILNFASSRLDRVLIRNAVVILPQDVDIGYCSGSCVHSRIRTTRDGLLAILQAPVEPCCFSNVLEPLNVLSHTNRGFQINRFQNVIVSSCDCRL